MQRERGPWSIPQEVSDGTRSSWSLVQSTSFLSQATLSVTREREFREIQRNGGFEPYVFWQAWVNSHPETYLPSLPSGLTSHGFSQFISNLFLCLFVCLFVLLIKPGGSYKSGKGSATELHLTAHPPVLWWVGLGT